MNPQILVPFAQVAERTEAQGAPTEQLAIIAGATWTLTVLLILVLMAYRRGGAQSLRRLEQAAARLTGLPGWAALPGLGAIAGAAVTIFGATWDIGLHIDQGRDEGPLGTAAHYPMLFGLFGMFLMGVLAIGLAPRRRAESSPVAYRLGGIGWVPAASMLLFVGSAFGMAAFPLDDFWHRLFGEDVTLWGPTHTMIIAGTATGGFSGGLLLIEGARAVGRNPFRKGVGLLGMPFPALAAGVCLFLWAAATHEFNWGVPQFRQIWQPLLLSFGGAQALVMARVMLGRGGAMAAIAVWLPAQLLLMVVVGGVFKVTMPAIPLFLAHAVIIELVGLRGVRNPTAFGAVAGLAVGTVGFAIDYWWSHVVMPLPWESTLLGEAIPVAAIAGLAGGLLSALTAQALMGTLPEGRRPLAIAIAAGVAFLALGANAADINNPEGVRAEISVTNIHMGSTPGHSDKQRVGDVTVRFSDPSITKDAQWVYALSWQGGGRFYDHMVQQADGTWRTTKPVPLQGNWKTLVRVHGGKTMLSVPVRFPPDPGIGFAGYPDRPHVDRAMVSDTKLMQIERRDDAPMWAWVPATLAVLAANVAIAVFIGFVCVRIGRIPGRTPTAPSPAADKARAAAPTARGAVAGAAT